MKKTLTVNLGGTVFHIDEDAYQLLDKYLSNLRIHFLKEEGAEEIMADFEMRISELLNERIRLGYEVITLEQVEQVIKRMGKPEEIFDEEEKQSAGGESKTILEIKEQPVKKRLMRDPDNRILGGVASGFAAYMDWDPTAVRIGMLVLIFFYGLTIPIYLLLWLIIPMARTATEKLQMRGESITIESIGKTVTDGFEKVSSHVNDYITSGNHRTAFQKFADGAVAVIGVILKVFLIMLAIILIPPILLALFLILIGIVVLTLGGGIGLLQAFFPFAQWDSFAFQMPETALVGTAVSTVLLVGIPIVLIVFALGSQFFRLKPLTSNAKWVLLVLFLGALFVNIYLASRYGFSFWSGMPWGSWNHPTWHSSHVWDSIRQLLP